MKTIAALAVFLALVVGAVAQLAQRVDERRASCDNRNGVLVRAAGGGYVCVKPA
jgi:uncharacterized protein YhdP